MEHAKYLRLVGLSVVASIALYAAFFAGTGLEQNLRALKELDPGVWVVILGLSLINYLLRFQRWEIYLGALGHPLPRGKNLLVYLGGFAFTTTPGKAGEALRSMYLKPMGVGYTESLAAFFVERLVDVMVMIAMAALALLHFDDFHVLVAALTATVAVALVALQRRGLVEWLAARGTADGDHLGRLASRLAKLFTASRALLRPTPLYLGFTLGLLSWGAEGVALHYIATNLGIELSLPVAVGIYSISILAGAVSLVPGGLGGTEAVMGLLLVLAGADAPSAVTATLVCRIATLWFAVAIGFLALAPLELGGRTRWSRSRRRRDS